MDLVVDVYHDISCPWCRIGKANLDAALAAMEGPRPVVRYRPFLLDPDAPESGRPLADHFREAKGIADPAPFLERAGRAGAEAGLRFRFDRALAAQTRDAHRLLLLAPSDWQSDLLDAMHVAHFERGADLSDLATLTRIAGEAGMDAAEALDLLESGAGTLELQQELRASHRVVPGGVPWFVFGPRHALSGAQPPETMREAIEAALGAAVIC